MIYNLFFALLAQTPVSIISPISGVVTEYISFLRLYLEFFLDVEFLLLTIFCSYCTYFSVDYVTFSG